MARKQKDYLEGLLSADELAPSPAPPPEDSRPRRRDRRGSTLIGRESALARVASGEVRQVTQLLIDPAKAKPWSGNARSYAHLTYDNCKELIDAIVAEGGQKVPAIVRRLDDDSEFEFEVVAGTRRHWSISWLRANSYPEMRFLVQVGEFDDEAAFRLADIENRARKDVSDLERARNYARALKDHYGGHQGRMAERLKLSQSWLSKMLKVAALPDVVVAAFPSPADVQLKPTYPLAQLAARSEHKAAIAKAAKAISAEQEERAKSGRPPLPAADVIKRLTGATRKAASFNPLTVSGLDDRPAITVRNASRAGLSVQLHSGHGLSRSELLEKLSEALDRLEDSGHGLQR